MSNTPNATASASVAFPVASLAVFVMLIMKLGNIAGFGSVSWWWVFSPWLISFLFILGILVVGAVGVGIAYLVLLFSDKRKNKKAAKERKARIAARKDRLR